MTLAVVLGCGGGSSPAPSSAGPAAVAMPDAAAVVMPDVAAATTPDIAPAVAADAPAAGCTPPVRAAGCAAGVPVTIKRFSSRAAFVAALASFCPRTVGFDDVDTYGPEPVAIAPDRYAASHGILLTGAEMQYVDDGFGYPADYAAVSAPNTFAPGPPATHPSGGHETEVSFRAGAAAACVAGFGAHFIDVDYGGGRSSLTVFDASNARLGFDDSFMGLTGVPIFVGMIALDAAGNPVPAIAGVRLVNGSGWPGSVSTADGVVIDSLVFDPPVAR